MTRDETFMNLALEQAKKALDHNEIAVGAVIVKDNTVIAAGYNLRETMKDPTAHAEIIALRNTASVLEDWRLNDCEMYCTLEPCCMCAGAIISSRLKRLVFGAFDSNEGFFGSIADILLMYKKAKKIEVLGGVLLNECREILRQSVKGIR